LFSDGPSEEGDSLAASDTNELSIRNAGFSEEADSLAVCNHYGTGPLSQSVGPWQTGGGQAVVSATSRVHSGGAIKNMET
jgi:hypothetical protein